MAPLARRTRAPRGQKPILRQRTKSYRKVSAIAALIVSHGRDQLGLFFWLYPNANINSVKVRSFLRDLSWHFQCPLVLLWDRLQARRARQVQTYIEEKRGWRAKFLPPYGPELNPVENVWGYLKTNAMANEAPGDLSLLTDRTQCHGRAIQQREGLLGSFLKYKPFFLRLL